MDKPKFLWSYIDVKDAAHFTELQYAAAKFMEVFELSCDPGEPVPCAITSSPINGEYVVEINLAGRGEFALVPHDQFVRCTGCTTRGAHFAIRRDSGLWRKYVVNVRIYQDNIDERLLRDRRFLPPEGNNQ